MDSLQLGVVLLLAAVAVFLSGYLLRLLVLSSGSGFGRFRDRAVLKKAALRLEKAEGLISNKLYREALLELRHTVLFDQFSDEGVIATLREHHQNVLSHCLVIAEQISETPTNIAALEELFLERAELLLLRIRTQAAYQRLLERREKSGKEIPSWSKDDFERKTTEIKHELERNRTELRTELSRLFDAIQSVSKAGIVYH